MSNVLIVGGLEVPMLLEGAGSKYRRHHQLDNAELYIDKNEVEEINDGSLVDRFLSKKKWKVKAGSATPFESFFKNWRANSLIWYRGIATSHFSYNDLLLKGKLRSERGAAGKDLPGATMGNSYDQKIRWLPGDVDPAAPQDIAAGNADAHMPDVSMTYPLPIGVTVAVRVGKVRNVPLAWLGPFEQQIRGPMRGQDFFFHSMSWMEKGQKDHKLCTGMNCRLLPPKRPYLTEATCTHAGITLWAQACATWMATNGIARGTGLQYFMMPPAVPAAFPPSNHPERS